MTTDHPADQLAGKLKRTEVQHRTSSIPGREIVVVLTEIPVGVESGWHIHPGEEIGYILEGAIVLEQEGKPVVTLGPGKTFFIPAGTVHNATNKTASPARVLANYIVEPGKPVATPVPPK